MIGLLILSSGDLDNFGLWVIYPPFHLIQVSFHPFALALVIPIYLVSNDLGVAVDNYACGSCGSGEVKARY